MGQVYVQVDANIVNSGINTLASSGDGEEVTSWLQWTPEGGFTGRGWENAWESPYVPLAKNFGRTLDEFKEYVKTAPNLDDLLGDWSNADKNAYIRSNHGMYEACTR